MLHLVYSFLVNAKKKTVICIMGIAVSIMLIFSLVHIGELILDAYKSAVMNTANYDFYYKDLDKDTADKMFELYGDMCFMTETVSVASIRESPVLTHDVVGVRGEWKKLYKTELLEGDEPRGSQDICLEEYYAKDKSLTVGERLLITLEFDSCSIEKEFVISGIVRDLPAYKRGSTLFLSMDAVEDIVHGSKQSNDYARNQYTDYMLLAQNRLASAEEIGEIAYDVYKEFDKETGLKIVYNEHRIQLRDDAGLYTGMRLIISIVIAVIAVSTIIFVYHIIRENFMVRIQQYGILQAVGCSIRDLRKIILLEILIYGGTGYLIGVLFGMAANMLLAKCFVRIFVGLDVCASGFRPQLLLYVLFILLFSLFVAYMFFVFSIRRLKPIEFIKGYRKGIYKKEFTCGNFFVELIINNCLQNKKTYGGLIITMIFSFLMIIVLGNGLGSISFDSRKTAMAFADTELCIAPDMDLLMGESGFDTDEITVIEDNCSKAYYISMERDYGVYDEKGDTVANLLIYSSNLMEKLRQFQHIKQDVAVVGSFRKDYGNTPSSVFIRNDKNSFELVIEEYVDFGLMNLAGEAIPGNGFVIVDEEYAKKLFGKQSNIVDMYLSECKVPRDRLLELFDAKDYLIYDLSVVKDTIYTQVQTICILIGYMFIAMFLLVIFMVSTVVRQNFEIRKKEIGMIFATGVKKSSIKKLLSVEIYTIMCFACLISGLIAIPVSAYMYYVVNQKIGIGWWGYFIGMPAAFLLLMILVSVNMDRCLRKNALELIREE